MQGGSWRGLIALAIALALSPASYAGPVSVDGIDGVEGLLSPETALAPLSVEARSKIIPQLDTDPIVDESQLDLPAEGEWGQTSYLAKELGLQVITYRNIGGNAIFEGDMDLGTIEEIREAERDELDFTYSPYAKNVLGITARNVESLWLKGTIPWCIAPGMSPELEADIRQAVIEWNQVLSKTVSWVETGTVLYDGGKRRCTARDPNGRRVRFVKVDTGICMSRFGRSPPGEQQIQLDQGCIKGDIVHEMGHAAGLLHEHTRLDRKEWIKVLDDNIMEGARFNFTQQRKDFAVDVGEYDYASVMHYKLNEFAKKNSGLMTLEPLRPVPAGVVIGKATKLSASDIATIESAYLRAKTSKNIGALLPEVKLEFVTK